MALITDGVALEASRIPSTGVLGTTTNISTETVGLKQDLSTLALRQAIGDNQVAYNLTSSFIDQFEDKSGIGTETNVGRAAIGEYVSTGGFSETQVFLSGSGTWHVSAIYTTAQIVVIGGGASGGRSPNVPGGGGGAGAMAFKSDYTFATADKTNGITYSVGAGGKGLGVTPYPYDGGGNNGGASTLGVATPGTITANGGGQGGGYGGQSPHYPGFTQAYYAAAAGGSGGGGSWSLLTGGASNKGSFTGWSMYGNAGGAGLSGNSGVSGGGGGAGGSGGDNRGASHGGHGGAGKELTEFANYGLGGWFCAGGGGGGFTSGGRGGKGGGGGGGAQDWDTAGESMGRGAGRGEQWTGGDAAPNTGSGGGGASENGYGNYWYKGGDGADGFIGINYNTSFSATGTLIGIASVPTAAQTKVSGVMTYKDGAGTATIGTDLKIYFTCDGGSNWTEAVSYTAVGPVFSTGVKMIKLGETTCTSGSDIRYKAVWANQSSGSKETQLHGIGLNY